MSGGDIRADVRGEMSRGDVWGRCPRRCLREMSGEMSGVRCPGEMSGGDVRGDVRGEMSRLRCPG